MRWLIFAIVLFLTAVLHITAGRFFPLAYMLIRPDFLALLALYYALYAPRQHAPLAAWIVGFVADLLSLPPIPPGAFALAFGGLAVLTLKARQLVYPEHPLSRVILALAWTALAHAFSFVLPWLFDRQNSPALWPFLKLSFGIGLYTAAFTPLYYLMVRKKAWLGLPVYRNHF